VWCEVFSVENCSGKNIFGIMKLKWNIANMIGFYETGFVLVNITNTLSSITTDSVMSGFCK